MNPDELPTPPRHVLLLDDEPEAHLLTAAFLDVLDGPPWVMDSAHSCGEALERAVNRDYQLFLVDYSLDGETGLDFLRAARRRGIDAPMIMLTAHGDRTLDLEAMSAGASDYLVKSELDPRSLDRSIRYALERKRAYDRLLRQEEELQRARKMEALARLAGGIAHDFNNLLTAMDGYTQMAMGSLAADDSALADLGEVRQAVTRAAALTDRLLTLSRKQVMRPRTFDLGVMVASLDHVGAGDSSEVLDLKVEVPPSPVHVDADPVQVKQALDSLIANAREAMSEGGQLELRMGTRRLDGGEEGLAAGGYCSVTVSDTGPGMDSDTLARALEPFFSGKDRAEHPGLGLATAYAIARQSGGTLSIESTPGEGTTVELLIPQVPVAAPRQRALHPAPAPDGAPTVLLTEGQDVVRRLLRRILERSGMHVITAASGDEALRRARAFDQPIHLLLTDLLMPAMSGRELADELRVTRPETKVLYMSGYSQEQAGMVGPEDTELSFLQKPFAPEVLTLRVRSLIEGGEEAS